MGEVIYGDIKQYIDELAQSLGVAAEHVYEILVRQQISDGIITIIATSLVWAALATAFYKAVKRDDFYEGKVTVTFIIGVASGVGIFFALIIGSFESIAAVKQLINPEYYAIREIMDVIKGGK